MRQHRKGIRVTRFNMPVRRPLHRGAGRPAGRLVALLLATVLIGTAGQAGAFAVGDEAALNTPAVEETDPGATPTPEETAPVPTPEETQSTPAPEQAETAPEQAPADAQVPAPKAARSQVAPLSVPAPSANEAVITVKVGGDRTGSAAASTLAGVKLRLHDGGANGAGSPRTESWATCISDAQGDCSFTVPETQPEISSRQCAERWLGICIRYETIVTQQLGANRDSQFWVVAESAASGWYLNPKLVTDNGDSAYQFRTGSQLRSGSTYTFGTSSFSAGSGSQLSGGTWQSSRNNPKLPITCAPGLRVALILDLSGSVGNAGATGTLKNASKGMVDALAGTGSSLALYTFGGTAPRSNDSSGRNYASLPIDTGSNRTTINGRIDGYSTGGGTNWDQGIWQVANDSASYDLAIVVTDGLATYYNGGGSGSSTRFIETERAIFSANALKAKGTRVLAVGVGDGIKGTPENLRAVSGEAAYGPTVAASKADFFQSDWNQLAGVLSSVAKGATCQADIDITKQTHAYGTSGPVQGGAGWGFSATATQGKLSPTGTQQTNSSGQVSYDLGFSSPNESADVTLKEVMTTAQTRDGWDLTKITCTVNGTNVPVSSPNAKISVTAGDQVDCTFLNTQTLKPGLTIEKSAWDTPTNAGLENARELPDGGSVPSGTRITWKYLVTNTGQTKLTGIAVIDDQLAANAVSCPGTALDVGKSMTCTASGPVTAR